jgi:hypothetical protein
LANRGEPGRAWLGLRLRRVGQVPSEGCSVLSTVSCAGCAREGEYDNEARDEIGVGGRR